jgi:hypothetical protein
MLTEIATESRFNNVVGNTQKLSAAADAHPD